nr:hypothetical protein [Tanacetum cinerariifolium]
MDNCDFISTPMATTRLDADLQGTLNDQTKYHSMIGGLMYLTASRLDIALATFVRAHYQARPKDSGFELIAYSDAYHTGCHDDCKSLEELFTEMPGDDDATKAESLPRGVDSYYRPGNFKDPSPIVYPSAANEVVSNFKIQPNLIAILPVFRGHEEPDVHLQEFFSTADTYQLQQQEQVVNLDSYTPEPSQCRKIPIYYDDDDGEESFTPLRDIIISELPPCIAITPFLSTKEPKDSVIMGDEHPYTIPEMKSNEFIKSSVKNLIPSLSDSKDISDGECDLPLCDDFPKSHLVTFSNPLFNIDNDFISSDDESFFEEDVPMDNFIILSNPLFNLDEEIISTKVNPIQNEVLESIISIPSGIDYFDAESNLIESLLNRNTLMDSTFKIDSLLDEFDDIHLVERLLYDNSSPRPPKEFNSKSSDAVIESFSPSLIPVEDSDSLMEEIDLFLNPDDSMPPGIENDDYDSKGDILFFEEFFSNDSLSLLENDSFHFDVPSSPRPPAKPPDDGIYFEPNIGILTVKVVDDISEHYVLMPRLLPT